MGAIAKLPIELVNQIAAGEVIERPASAVKELVENSLDAGATRIAVEIEDGGKRLIRITDNGGGITPEDLPLAIAPHATSKLHTAADLFNVHTLGFRGEALASIASISRLAVVSRPPAAEVAAAIRASGDQASDVEPAAGATGTVVEVRELFFNTPARRKFLKSERSESAAVAEQLIRLALAHPHVSFTLKSDGRLVYDLPATDDLAQRLGDLFGRELVGTLMPVRAESELLHLHGFVGRPIDARPTARWQYLTVNGRFVRDRHIAAAIKEAYHGLIDFNRYPTFFLFLVVDPARVDVNVHPTKNEVRFEQADRVRSAVYHALKATLAEQDLVGAMRPPAGATGPGRGSWTGGSGGDLGPTPDEQHRIRETLALQLQAELMDRQQRLAFTPPSDGVASLPAVPVAASAPSAMPDSPPAAAADPLDPLAARRPGSAPAARGPAAVQVLRTYLVAEDGDGLVIVDQHALHERVLYQSFFTRITGGPLQGQRLLVPEPFKVTPTQAAAADEHAGLLARLGIELAPFGPGQLAVHSFPAFLQRLSAAEFVGELLERLADAPAALSEEDILHRVVDMMACKAAIKAGDPLSPDEIAALLASARAVERSAHCPHGRPTMLRLSRLDLQKQFHRVK